MILALYSMDLGDWICSCDLYQHELFAEVNQDFPGGKGLLVCSNGWEQGQQRLLLIFFVERRFSELNLGVKTTEQSKQSATTAESVTYCPRFCQRQDTHHVLSNNWKISVPLSAASFLLCYTSPFVIKVTFSGLVNKGGLMNDPRVHCCWSPRAAAAALWLPQTFNWSLSWSPVYSKNELASEWEGYEFLSCPARPGMTTVVPGYKVCHYTAITLSSARAYWMKGVYMKQTKPYVLYVCAGRRKACKVRPASRRKCISLFCWVFFCWWRRKHLRSDYQCAGQPFLCHLGSCMFPPKSIRSLAECI